MWVLPPRPLGASLSVEPGSYVLPYWWQARELDIFTQLLRLFARPHMDVARLPIQALGLASGPIRCSGGLIIEIGSFKPNEETLSVALGRAAGAAIFLKPGILCGPPSGWLQQQAHKAAVDGIREWVEHHDHPLRHWRVEHLDPRTVARRCADPVELVLIIEEAIGHRLSVAPGSVRPEDWDRSLLRATGWGLGRALTRMPEDVRQDAICKLVGIDLGPEKWTGVEEALGLYGLATGTGEDFTLGPLARSATEDGVAAGLLEELLRHGRVAPAIEAALLGPRPRRSPPPERNSEDRPAHPRVEIALMGMLARKFRARAQPADPPILEQVLASIEKKADDELNRAALHRELGRLSSHPSSDVRRRAEWLGLLFEDLLDEGEGEAVDDGLVRLLAALNAERWMPRDPWEQGVRDILELVLAGALSEFAEAGEEALGADSAAAGYLRRPENEENSEEEAAHLRFLAFTTRCRCALAEGRLDDAMVWWRRAEEIAQSDMQSLRYETLELQISILEATGREQEVLDRILAVLAEEHDPARRLPYLELKQQALRRQRRHAERISFLQTELIPLLRDLDDSEALRDAYDDLARALRQDKRPDEALDVLRVEVEPRVDPNDESSMLDLEDDLLACLDDLNRHTEVLELIRERLLPRALRLGDHRTEAWARFMLVYSLGELEREEEALDELVERALPLELRVGDRESLSHLLKVGVTLLDTDDLAEVAVWSSRALKRIHAEGLSVRLWEQVPPDLRGITSLLGSDPEPLTLALADVLQKMGTTARNLPWATRAVQTWLEGVIGALRKTEGGPDQPPPS